MRQSLFLLLLVLLAGPQLVFGQKKERKSSNTDSAPAVTYEKGTLTDGRHTGIWEYYDQQGELTLRMNYDSSRIAYSRPDTARYLLYLNNDWQLVRPSRAPQYMGSRAKRTADIGKSIRYPVAALQQGQQGEVVISYVVNEQGKTQDYQVVTTPSKECTEAVWAVLKQQPDRWIPAVYQGQPTRAQFLLRVNFAMVNQQEAAAYQARVQQQDQRPQAPYIDQVRVTAYGVERTAQTLPAPSRPGQRAQMPR
ncbi:energy transducer TonB [Hymenobacter lapidiphilus]|uniref:Energy transducer TonB n=1 Tax=Hymenobacter lapidiphilus TaxID=2608003 RepID=A0A7Y7PQJ9_9BACT|nr:energy transducer TonB [Hymenobacter lapidiphilus]NVO32060.1 energy transducer TonB [Hymenobacter lapidiphilus]